MSAISSLLPDQDGLNVAFDTEASGLFVDEGARISVATLAWYPDPDDLERIETRLFAFDHGPAPHGVPKEDLPRNVQQSFFDEAPNLGQDEWDDLCAWLLRQNLIAHNLKYDAHIFRAGHRLWGRGVDLTTRAIWDTMVVSPMVFPNRGTALKPLAEWLWGEQESETQRNLDKWLKKNGKRYDLAPWDLLAPYATKDAELALRLWQHQLALIAQGEVPESYHLLDEQVDLAIALFRMECRGLGFDADGCRAACEVLIKERDALRRELSLRWGRQCTPDGARWWFYQKNGVEPTVYTDSNLPSVDQEAVNDLVAKGAPDAQAYADYQLMDGAISRWYGSWPDKVGPDGRLRPSYWQTKSETGRGTVTGRLAVERVQLQAVPHDNRLPKSVPSLRTFFHAKDGYELWEIDLSQAEVRVATHVCKCEGMRQVLLAGGDTHGETCKKVFDVYPGDDKWDFYRSVAKRLTFATLYGAGPRTFQKTLRQQAHLDVPFSQAKQWLNEYRETFPEFMTQYRQDEWAAENKGFIVLETGKYRWFSDYERKTHAYKALNARIQGNVAAAMNRVKIEVELAHPGVLLHEVHDSLVLELPEGDAGLAKAAAVEEVMLATCRSLFSGWDKDHPVPWKADAKRFGEKD